MPTNHNTPVRYNGKGSGYEARKEMPIGIDTDFFGIVDDFVGEAVDDTNDWSVVKDTGATVEIASDSVGGVMAITSATNTDNDGGSIQSHEIFKPTANKHIWAETRVKLNEATESDFYFGLTEAFATNPEAVLTAAERIGFQKDDGSANILCKTEADTTETSTDSGQDMSDDTWVKLGLSVEGTSAVRFYVNDSLVATHTANINSDENMCVGVFSRSGDTTTTNMTTSVDYVVCVQER